MGRTVPLRARPVRHPGGWRAARGLSPTSGANYDRAVAIDYTKKPKPDAQGGGAAGGGVNLGKVRLTKDSSTSAVNLTKGGSEPFRVNLNWNARPDQPQGGGGFMKKLKAAAQGGGAIDLDLGCLYELANGDRGAVQALGNAFGSLNGPPFIQLDADDRSGSASGGENLRISAQHIDQIRKVLVYAFIYEGVPNWAAADGLVTVYQQGAGEVEIPLDETQQGKGMCALALLENQGGQLKLSRQVRYFGNHRDMDAAFGFGLNWQAGRK